MRFAILANRANSFVLPLAQGLQRLLNEIRVEAKVFHFGTNALARFPSPNLRFALKFKNAIKDLFGRPYLLQLRGYDAIVIIGPIPGVFLRSLRVEILREMFPDTPIVLYSNYYLPTRGQFGRWLKEGNVEHGIPDGGHYGLERYDWYLCSSTVSEYPMPPGPQPCSLIGIHLCDGTLFPDQQGKFMALVDFERPEFLEERAVQLQALKETNTPYIELKGSYPLREIRQIYRKTSIYFVAHRESFGLPICELQACGSFIFTPSVKWCPSHYLKDDLSVWGQGTLSPNFVVYENDKDRLVEEIKRIRDSYDPSKVLETFKKYHPHLLHGDKEEIVKFVEMIRNGGINSKLRFRNASVWCPSDAVGPFEEGIN